MRLLLGLLGRGVGGVAFLPEELGGAEEQPGAHLPADDVGPLVDEQRQVAVALDPLLVGVPDDGFGRGADDERLFQFGGGIDVQGLTGLGLEPVVGDDGAFLGEPLGHLLLFGEEAHGDEQGEVRVDVPGVFEELVEPALHLLPQGEPGGLDDHAAPNVGVVG